MATSLFKQTASDVMTRHVDTIHSKETIHDALVMMTANHLSALPVINAAGRCVGTISQSDLIAVAREADARDEEIVSQSMTDLIFGGVPLEDLTNERIEDVMSENVVTISPDDSVIDIADTMLNNGVHHVPVCDGEGKLCGIVSTMDILAGLRAAST